MEVSYLHAEAPFDDSLVGDLLRIAKGVLEVIETEVLQRNHAMQQLNEASGFKAAGVRIDKAEARIVYRKHKR